MAKSLAAKLELDPRGFTRGLGRVEARSRQAARKMKDTFAAAARSLTSLPGMIATGFAGASIIKATKLSAEAEEIRSQFGQVFKDLTDESREWSRGFAADVNRGKVAVEGWMAGMQDTFVPLGFARRDAMELSKGITQLTVDLASFKNMSESDVLARLQGGLIGNHENLQKFGVIITETALKQKAWQMGILDSKRDLSSLEKVLVRYQMILEGTTDAQGDAIRTAGSFTNQVRGMKAQWKDLQIAVGDYVTQSPVVHGVIRGLGATFKSASESIQMTSGDLEQHRTRVTDVAVTVQQSVELMKSAWYATSTVVKEWAGNIMGSIGWIDVGMKNLDKVWDSAALYVKVKWHEMSKFVGQNVEWMLRKLGNLADALGMEGTAAKIREWQGDFGAGLGELEKDIERSKKALAEATKPLKDAWDDSEWGAMSKSFIKESTEDYERAAGHWKAAWDDVGLRQRLGAKKTGSELAKINQDTVKNILGKYKGQTDGAADEAKKRIKIAQKEMKEYLRDARRAADGLASIRSERKGQAEGFGERVFRLETRGMDEAGVRRATERMRKRQMERARAALKSGDMGETRRLVEKAQGFAEEIGDVSRMRKYQRYIQRLFKMEEKQQAEAAARNRERVAELQGRLDELGRSANVEVRVKTDQAEAAIAGLTEKMKMPALPPLEWAKAEDVPEMPDDARMPFELRGAAERMAEARRAAKAEAQELAEQMAAARREARAGLGKLDIDVNPALKGVEMAKAALGALPDQKTITILTKHETAMAGGGSVGGLDGLGGGWGTDTVPAMLTPGEFVVNRDSARRFRGILEQINAGTFRPRGFAVGGSVSRGSTVDNRVMGSADVHISISAQGGVDARTVRSQIIPQIEKAVARGRIGRTRSTQVGLRSAGVGVRSGR